MPEFHDYLNLLLDDIERRHQIGGSDAKRVSTGLPRIDELTGGLGPGGWLIQSERGVGATALLLKFVRALALRTEQPAVRLLSVGLSPAEMTERLVAAAGRVSIEALRSGRLRPEHWERLVVAYRALAETRLSITDARDWSQGDFEMWCADERPAAPELSESWLAIDDLDLLRHPGVLSLPRLEHLSGRRVIATTHRLHEPAGAAQVISRLVADEFGHRFLIIGRPPTVDDHGRVDISIHPMCLEVEQIDTAMPRMGQLNLGLNVNRVP